MESILRIKNLYQNYCQDLKNEITNLQEKMNQDFDASINNYNPESKICLNSLSYYNTKQILNDRINLFKKECKFAITK
jgi:hypothetical protein